MSLNLNKCYTYTTISCVLTRRWTFFSLHVKSRFFVSRSQNLSSKVSCRRTTLLSSAAQWVPTGTVLNRVRISSALYIVPVSICFNRGQQVPCFCKWPEQIVETILPLQGNLITFIKHQDMRALFCPKGMFQEKIINCQTNWWNIYLAFDISECVYILQKSCRS